MKIKTLLISIVFLTACNNKENSISIPAQNKSALLIIQCDPLSKHVEAKITSPLRMQDGFEIKLNGLNQNTKASIADDISVFSKSDSKKILLELSNLETLFLKNANAEYQFSVSKDDLFSKLSDCL